MVLLTKKQCQRNRLKAERLMVVSDVGPPLKEFPFEYFVVAVVVFCSLLIVL